MSGWNEIARRAQQATGPDRDLDRDVMVIIRGGRVPDWIATMPGMYWDGCAFEAPDLTASTDATLRLITSVLPGAMWSVCSMEDGPYAQIIRPMPGGGYSGGLTSSGAQEPALALVAAFALAMEPRP